MNLLDWLLVALVLTYALSGYWQGFITGAFATFGLLLGGGLGVWLAPKALGDANPSLLVSLGALFIVILSASLGQAFLQYAGARLRSRIKWQPLRVVDAVGGSVLSAAAVLLVAWALGVAISGSGLKGITKSVNQSRVLAEVNDMLPDQASSLLGAFNDVVGVSFFPRYLEPFAPERIVPVEPGPERLLTDPDVVRAEDSVVKIETVNACGRGVEGSGVVIGPNRVMTNAHVVAGSDSPSVVIGESSEPARVVFYDSKVDVAVLAVNTGEATPMRFDTEAKAEDGVAILGYPNDGPFDIETARIRAQQRLRSPDIYGDGAVIRQVFSLRGLIRPGNSGGPVVSSAGEVVGLVFAASVTSSDTGYALTAEQVAPAAASGLGTSKPVDTGECLRD